MHLVHPIQEEHCRPFVGRPICAVLNDGKRYIGILSGIEKGRLILNDHLRTESTGEAEPSSDRTTGKFSRKKGKSKSKGEKVEISAIPSAPYAPARHPAYGERSTVDLSQVALLFLLFV
ncbi:hypothetical protein [Paenibacillus sp. MBLB4367]|uniref:hypothetical protein n=1 Tax=Paenibacillus sp. MBLB4367 TaxID=3384767 RepID=UPI0039083CC4